MDEQQQPVVKPAVIPEVSGGPTGAVLVVGGGISGMQSALDLAEAGFKVYLAEEKPAIGGNMARLDKTFPTNDCAMCIMSPKLVDTGRHLNIELLTGTKVLGLEGGPGNFTVKLLKKARYVDLKSCTGCGDCSRACPVNIPNDFDAGIGTRNATYKLYAQATPNAFAIDKRGTPPCRAACPAGVNAQGYIQLIATERYNEAWSLIYRDNPFPAACGRICNHPCQSECHRGKIDESVEIMRLKRVATDHAYSDLENITLPETAPQREERIAVVGAGPAGLSAAYQLVKRGYRVTVFEAMPKAGGAMRYGIPEYRLPKKWVDVETELLEKLGVEIKYGTPIGSDLTVKDLFKQGYRCVFLSVGAQKGMGVRAPGEDLDGVMTAVDMLRRMNMGEKVDVAGNVAVIGGGNVAMDAARSALRLGASEVHVYALEADEQMPASREEIDAAREEGIIFHNSCGVKSILGEGGKVKQVEIRTCCSVFDDQGRFSPCYLDGSESVYNADRVILAAGQSPDLAFLGEEYASLIGPGSRITADPDTLATSIPGVFAGGDAVTGPRTVIMAVGAGKAAAESIDRYINGQDLRADREFKVPEERIAPLRQSRAEVDHVPPVQPAHVPAEIRASSFVEETEGYTDEQALQEASRCLNCGVCSECMECVKVCLPKCIDHTMQDEEVSLKVGAVVINPGFAPYDASNLDYYGFGKYPNVVTSLQFERILSASGPFQGHLIRPYDHKEPQRIAWIQCVGSRNERIGNGYCSSVCCMYAIKEAIIAKEHSPGGLDTTIFFMDMRTHGKDFERYYDRAREEHGVKFVRSRIYEIMETQDENKNILLRYADENGELHHEEFDMVVLSIGLRPSDSSKELAERLGVELDEFGFCRSAEFSPTGSSREGVFVAGSFAEPKDIPETVVEASAAASRASMLLAKSRNTLTEVKEYPPERDVTEEAPRVGVFVCNCGINIGSIVKVPEVVEHASALPYVAHAQEFLFTCSADSIDKIKSAIEEHNLNRVVVASCSPRTHAPLFMASLREAGLNPHLYDQVNIREHCSWVHRDVPVAATAKAKELVSMGVAKARLLQPVETTAVELDQRALVVGGGAAGMTAALSLAEQGFETILVERENELGGNLRHILYTPYGGDPQGLLGELINKVKSHPMIHIYTGAEVVDVTGYLGNYNTKLKIGNELKEVNHGAVIIATGARETQPVEYLYGQHPAVITQTQLEERLNSGDTGGAKTYAMIQCVGSREPERPYCSRVCCTNAIKNALKIKEIDPEATVYIMYRDIRTYGFKEKLYTEARNKGIIFIRYAVSEKPLVEEADGKLQVTVRDHVLGERIVIRPDILALSAAIEPNSGNNELSQIFKLTLNTDGFYSEAHMKLRPVDFAADGLYLCGLAHAPKLLDESLAQANAAAVRAVTLLSKGKLESLGIVATVKEKNCRGCGICVQVCNYSAREIDEETNTAVVREVLCQGCGACVASCPSGASQQKNFEKTQIMAMIDAAV